MSMACSKSEVETSFMWGFMLQGVSSTTCCTACKWHLHQSALTQPHLTPHYTAASPLAKQKPKPVNAVPEEPYSFAEQQPPNPPPSSSSFSSYHPQDPC